MEISDARKLKALEDENRRLKKLLAESMLDASTLKEMLGKTSDAQLAETCCETPYLRFIKAVLGKLGTAADYTDESYKGDLSDAGTR